MFYEENCENIDKNRENCEKVKPFSYKQKKAGDKYKISQGNEYVIQERHKAFGLFIRSMREGYGMTIGAVVTQCNIPKSTYQMIEAGDMRIKFAYIERVLMLFGYNLMPVLDFNNAELMSRIKELPKKTDYLLAMQMSKEATKNPIMRRFSRTQLSLERFLIRFQKKRDIRLANSDSERLKIAKKYRDKLKKLRGLNRFVLSFMPSEKDRKICGVIMRKYNAARKRRQRLAKRPKVGE